VTIARIGPIARDVPDPPDVKTAQTLAAVFLWQVEGNGEEYAYPKYVKDPRVPIIAAALGRIGATEVRRALGAGSFGVAAEMSDGRVVKVTADPAEVQVGAALVGKRLMNVVEIYGAWYIRGITAHVPVGMNSAESELLWEDWKIGLLVEQQVQRRWGPGGIDESARRALSRFVFKWKESTNNEFRDFAGMNDAEKREKLRIASEGLEVDLTEQAQQYSLNAVDEESPDDPAAVKAKLFENVASAVSELRDLGIYAIDVHGGNVGYDDDDKVWRIFDVGVGSPPEMAPSPEELAVTPEQPATKRQGKRKAPGPEQLLLFREGLQVASAVYPPRHVMEI